MSKFTHLICDLCWFNRYPDKLNPCRIMGATLEPCCVCLHYTDSGIYFRGNPDNLACNNPTSVHEENQ